MGSPSNQTAEFGKRANKLGGQNCFCFIFKQNLALAYSEDIKSILTQCWTVIS